MTAVAVTGEQKAYQPADLGCAGCGDCCERISIGTPLQDLGPTLSGNLNDPAHRRRTDKPVGRAGSSAREAAFILRHWHPTGDVVRHGDRVKQVLSCDQFDPVHRVCLAHDTRPAVCSDYPWYGRPPDGSTIREPHCSYLLDVPPDQRGEGARPLIPLTVLR